MRSTDAWLLAATAVLALGGCGDPDLWARYQAERSAWRAHRLVDRIQLNPQVASEADFERARTAYAAVVAGFPAARWASPERMRSPLARDVATVAGRAMIALHRIDEMQGRIEPAIAGYARAESEFVAVRPVALEAALARAAALGDAGRDSSATEVYAGIIGRFPMIDSETGASILPVMDAPLRVARDRAEAGHVAAAEATLRAAERDYLAEIERQRGRPPAIDLWVRLARARTQGGRTDGAIEALRQALSEPGADVSAMLLAVAEVAIEGGRPDSAFAYTAWAERAFGDSVRARSMVLTARAWDRRGPPDSALAAWGRFLDAFPGAIETSTMARFQRGLILEGLGRWDQARTEYHTLVAGDPTHDLAFDARRRLAARHGSRGDLESARIEVRDALEDLQQVIATNRNEHVLQLARQTYADLLLSAEDWQRADLALREIWSRYGGSPDGVGAGFRAAELTEARLHDGARALALYRELADHATLEGDRRRAREHIARLERGRG